ncbi:MAG TPA: hypothetical protein VIU33_09835, partial [Nitrospiria bacterium]
MKGKGPALKFGIPLAALTIFFLVLPETSLQDFTPADSRPFRWDRSDLFSSLQQEFESIRSGSAVEAAVETADLLTRGREISKGIREGGDDIPFDLLTRLETVQFRAAAIAAA